MIRAWFRRPMWQRVAAAFILGIFAGSVLGKESATWIKPLGDIYVNLVRMIVVPLIFFSIAASIARLNDTGKLARLGVRTLFWFLATSAFAVIVGIGVGYLVNPGLGLSILPLGEVNPRVMPSFWEVLIGIVPTNPIKPLLETNVLQVIVLASLVGAGIVSAGEKVASIRNVIVQGEQLVFSITRWILQLTPIGTFGLIAWVVGQHGFISLMPLSKFIAAMYIACLCQIVVVYGGLIKLHGLSVITFMKKALPAQQMAFATSSSVATLPMTLRTTVAKFGVPESYANFAVPLGANIKMDGCGAIYPVMAAIFIAQYFSLELSWTQYLVMAFTALVGSLGVVGVPGTSIVVLTMMLTATGLPLEGIGYIIAIDRVIDMMRTATNVTGQMLVPVLTAKGEGILNETIYNRQHELGIVSEEYRPS